MSAELQNCIENLKNSLSLIVAVSKNWAIGKNGTMPWHLPEDLKYFKATTLNKPILMGRNTFASLGKPLPDRQNIVITKDVEFRKLFEREQEQEQNNKLSFCSNLQEGLKLADEFADKLRTSEIMVIGGGSIYAQLMRYAHKIYISHIDVEIADADTFFPKINPEDWILQNSEQKNTFIAEVWQNRRFIEKALDLPKQKDLGELTQLTAQIESKVEKVLHKFEQMNLDKRQLQDELRKGLSQISTDELALQTDFKQADLKVETVEIEENKIFMDNLKTDENSTSEQKLDVEKPAQAPSDFSKTDEKIEQNEKNEKSEQGNSSEQEKASSKKSLVDEILEFWQNKYPNTFFKEEVKPLKIGIHLDLFEAGDFSVQMIKRTLAHYTKRPRYLRSMQEGAVRVDFNGETQVKVTKEDEADAKEALEIIRKRNKERDAKNPKKANFKKTWNKKPNSGKKPFNKNAKFAGGTGENGQSKGFKKPFVKKTDTRQNFNPKFNNTKNEFKDQTAQNQNSQNVQKQQSTQAEVKPEDATRFQNKLQKLSDKYRKSS